MTCINPLIIQKWDDNPINICYCGQMSNWSKYISSASWKHCSVSDHPNTVQFSSVQSLSRIWLFVTPWIAACQASLSITSSWSLLKLMPIESVMPSNHLILCRPLLLPPPIPPSIRVFSNESTLRITWPKYWSFSFSISPSNEHRGLISETLVCQQRSIWSRLWFFQWSCMDVSWTVKKAECRKIGSFEL